MSGRWIELLEAGDKGLLAMRNLTILITIIIGSITVVYMALMATLTGEIFACYMLAGGGVYSFGKWQDDRTTRSRIEADAAPDSTVNTTNIAQADKVNVAGDATTKPNKGKK